MIPRTTVDTLYIYDAEMQRDADRFLEQAGGSSAAHPVGTIYDITKVVNAYTMVKLLILDTHGSPGALWVSSGGKALSLEFMKIEVNQNFLRKEARVLFLGCEIAAGTDGDKFLDAAGRYLLTGKGGIVGGTTVTNFTLGYAIPEASMFSLTNNAQLKVRRYDASGQRIGSLAVNPRHGFVN